MRWLAATGPISYVYARVLHHVDRLTFRLTWGRHTFANLVSGLPVVMLTTTGAKSGEQRTVPVLGLPDGSRTIVVASNWGQRHHPAWYINLRAHPEASIDVGGHVTRVQAHEIEGEERERLWRRGVEIYPGWSAYKRRAGERQIPVIALEGVS